MKKLITLAVLLIISTFALYGCEQAITPADIQALTEQKEALQQQVDVLQEAATQMTADMQAAGILDPCTVAKVAKINAEADKVQLQVNNIAAALKAVQLTGDVTKDWLSMLQAANAASTPFNPYALPIAASLTLASFIFGLFQRKQVALSKAALTEVVKGAQVFKKSADAAAVTVFKDAQDSAQSASTKELVGAIKANL